MAAARNSGKKRPIRAVVVDDSPHVLDGLCAFLRRCPDVEIVGTANNGVDAIELACSCQPDLVLLDVHMPGMSGVEVASCLSRTIPEVWIVTMTAFETAEVRDACMFAGARLFTSKHQLANALPKVFDQLSAALQSEHRTQF